MKYKSNGKTIWLYTYKYRPYPDWGIWTNDYVGTEELFKEYLKHKKIEPIKIKRKHWKPLDESEESLNLIEIPGLQIIR